MTRFTALAPAKVNLFLHVGPAKANGRHDLDSLVVFSDAAACDEVTAEPDGALSLTVSGPFAPASGTVEDNLVLRAALALQTTSGCRAGARLTLVKRLPVAAGIGGGSSDAAAALRLLTQLWDIDPAHASAIAPSLGGDVPVALAGVPALMRGEGERVHPVKLPGRLAAVLINPGVPCPTGPVFRGFDAGEGGHGFAEINPFPDFKTESEWLGWLARQRNDLEAPAKALTGGVASVLDFLRAQPGVKLARMSGSGATCFAAFETLSFAERAAAAQQDQNPGWWSAACSLGARP